MNTPAADAPPILNPTVSSRRTLRKLFLMLFLRGRSSRGLKKETAPKSVGQRLALTLLFYAIFGGLIASNFRHQSIFALSVGLHAMTFIFLGMFVASSAGEVLFNKEEGDILMHRPILPEELLWAKIGVLVEVSLWLAGAFNLVGFYIGTVNIHGGWLFVVAHIGSTILEALFCSGCIVMIYQLCLRWFGRERLDALMTTVQVFVAIAIMLAGQLMPRMVVNFGGTLRLDADSWWLVLLPPAWFAGFDDALAGSGQASAWVLGGLGLLTTLIVLWFAFGKLAGDYETGLQTLAETVSRPRKKSQGRRWLSILVDLPPFRWWLRDSVERASFLLAAAYLFRDRDVKLRVYPALAPMLAVPVIFLTQGRGGGGDFMLAIAGGYLGLVPLLGLNLLQYSQQWQAADIFRAAPIAGPGPLCHGARRAVLFFLTLPIVIGFALIVGFMHTKGSPLILVLPGLLSLPIYAMIPCLGGHAVPLSMPTEEAKSTSRGLSTMAAMIIGLALSMVSALSWTNGWFYWLLSGEIILVIGLYIFMRHLVSKTRWKSLE